MPSRAESNGPSGAPAPATPSIEPSVQRTLLSLPSPGDALTIENTCTVEVRGLPTPGSRGTEPEPSESGTQALLRAFNPGVTDEHDGRYLRSDAPASELGRGGIGRVFVALDRHLEREVAIKELLPQVMEADGLEPLQAVTRFLREARVTGRLEHPNIVPVYELGKREDGTLYYTMRVVRGRTLARAIADASDLSARLPLVNHFSGLCQAIAYAHSRGVVHRDIKPENVMIGEFGETVVLDWGMAKVQKRDPARERGADSESSEAAESSGTNEASGTRLFVDLERADITLEGSVCGTPLYMSPEQALGQIKDIDERSDVWSLGVVLYTVLAGKPPFTGRGVLEIVERVKAGAYVPLRKLNPAIPPELAAVVDRALRPVRAERYATAREIARDIQAYQAGARVLVYEYSSWELLKRFVARQRAAVVASAIGLAAVAGLGAAAYERVVRERDRAVAAEHRAVTNARSAKQSEAAAKQSLLEMLAEKAERALAEGDTIEAQVFAAHALVLGERPDARGIWIAAASSLRPAPARAFHELRGCDKLAFTFEGRLALCARETALELWSTGARKRLWARGALPGKVVAFSFAPARIAIAFSDGTVELREQTDGTVVFRRRITAPTSLAVSSDGGLLAAGSARGQAFVWSPSGREPERALVIGQSVSALSFAQRGDALAVGGELGAVWVFRGSVSEPFRVLAGHTGTVRGLAFAELGRYLASAGADRVVRLWDVETGTLRTAPIPHSDAIGALSWSEDKHFLAFAGKDRSFTLADLRGGVRKTVVRRFDDAVELALLSPDLRELATYGKRDGLELWTLPASAPPPELSERGNVLALALLPGAGGLSSAGLGQNGVCLWNVQLGECSTRLPVRLDRVRALAVSPDGASLAVAGSGERVFVWDLAQRVPRQVIEGPTDEVRALSFSANGAYLASAGLDKKVRVFDAATGRALRVLDTSGAVHGLGFIGATDELVAGGRDGTLSFWNAETGAALGGFRAHDDWVLSLAVAPGGRRVATAGADRRVRVWDIARRAGVLDLAGHEGKVLTVDYSADGALIASASEDKVVRIWDAQSGRALAVLPHTSAAVRVVRFAPSEPVLVSGSDDGSIRFWQIGGLRTPAGALLDSIEERFGITLAGSRVVRK